MSVVPFVPGTVPTLVKYRTHRLLRSPFRSYRVWFAWSCFRCILTDACSSSGILASAHHFWRGVTDRHTVVPSPVCHTHTFLQGRPCRSSMRSAFQTIPCPAETCTPFRGGRHQGGTRESGGHTSAIMTAVATLQQNGLHYLFSSVPRADGSFLAREVCVFSVRSPVDSMRSWELLYRVACYGGACFHSWGSTASAFPPTARLATGVFLSRPFGCSICGSGCWLFDSRSRQ